MYDKQEAFSLSVERIIMITGSKGGGGKTPIALSIALTLNEFQVPVLACDFNFNNSDLLSILHGANVHQRKRKNDLQQVIIGTDPFWRIDRNLWITRWGSTIDLGLPSTAEMWNKIRKLTQLEFAEEQPKIMVIDTNLTLPLICPPATEIQNYDDLPPIEVFHLWSPSIVLQVGEQERFIKAMNLLKRFNKGFEERMTHVFTPRHYANSSFMGSFSSYARGEFSIAKSVKFKQTNPKPILFEELQSIVFAGFLPNLLNIDSKQGLQIEELLATWMQKITDHIKKRAYRTNNVIIVPTVVNKIALLVEALTLKPRRTLESIRSDIGSLYNLIGKHIKDNRRDLISQYYGGKLSPA